MAEANWDQATINGGHVAPSRPLEDGDHVLQLEYTSDAEEVYYYMNKDHPAVKDGQVKGDVKLSSVSSIRGDAILRADGLAINNAIIAEIIAVNYTQGIVYVLRKTGASRVVKGQTALFSWPLSTWGTFRIRCFDLNPPSTNIRVTVDKYETDWVELLQCDITGDSLYGQSGRIGFGTWGSNAANKNARWDDVLIGAKIE